MICVRCQSPTDDPTFCHSTREWLCEECIILLAYRYFTHLLTADADDPSIISSPEQP